MNRMREKGWPRWGRLSLALGVAAVLWRPDAASALLIGSGDANTDGTGVAGWDYVGNVGGGNIIYLGNGWALSAAHVGVGGGTVATFGAGGAANTYTVASGSVYTVHDVAAGSPATDLVLFRLQPNSVTGLLPQAAPLSLPTDSPAATTNLTLVSYGPWVATPTYWRVTKSTTSPWTWTQTTYANANEVGFDYSGNGPAVVSGVERWGTNQVNGTTVYDLGSWHVRAFWFDFYAYSTSPSYPLNRNLIGGTASEAALGNGDSGGGVFGYDANDPYARVKLLGVLETKFPFYATAGNTSTDDIAQQPDRTAAWGNASGAVDIASYAAQMAAYTNTFEWTSAGSGAWSSTHWNEYLNPLDNSHPGVTGPTSLTSAGSPATASINLLNAITDPTTITLDVSPTIATLNFAHTIAYTLAASGGNTLTLSNQGNGALVADWQGSHTINVPLVLADAATFHVAGASDTLTLGGSLSGAYAMTKTGAGTLVTPALPSGSIAVTAGTLRLAAGAAPQAARVASLAVTGGQFDLTDHDLVVTTGSYAALRSLLSSAYASGTWSGSGITSSLAAASSVQGIALISGAAYQNLRGSSLFGGVTLQPTDLLLKLTYMGDADLSGQVTLDDYAQLDAGFLLQPANPGWSNGDFNYDGLINYQDYALIDAAYQQQGGPLANQMLALHAAWFGQLYTAALDAVPEPATLGLLGLSAALLLCRRSPRRV